MQQQNYRDFDANAEREKIRAELHEQLQKQFVHDAQAFVNNKEAELKHQFQSELSK